MARADHELIMVQSKHVTRELRQLSVSILKLWRLVLQPRSFIINIED